MNNINIFFRGSSECNKNKIAKISSNYFWIFSISLIFVLLRTTSAFSYDLEKQVKKYTLDNGLKILIVERDFSPTVSLYIRHKVGAVDEKSGKTGTAHFLEHMLFKGTNTIGTKNIIKEKKLLKMISQTGEALDRELMKEKEADKLKIKNLQNKLEQFEKEHEAIIISNEIDRLYTENGADSLNASTSQDVTTYQVSLPANKLELWARIESERMLSPVFREFYAERKVVMEERRQRIESDPDGMLLEQFLAVAFIAHPYRRPIIGWPSDINYLTMTDLEGFLRDYHTPSNTVIAVVGDIKHRDVLQVIKKYFGAIPNGLINSNPITKEPPQSGERRININFEANPRLIIGYHKPSLPDHDDYVFDVIQTMLTDGRTSRLYKSLVESRSIAESISASNGLPGTRYPNLFTIYASPRHPHHLAELEAAIVSELERLKKEPIATRELDKVKNTLKADFIKSLDSNAELAAMLSYYETIAGDYRYIINHIKTIDKINSDDIQRVAKKYFTDFNKTVATLQSTSVK